MTGAPVPAGADAIVMVEDTERLGVVHGVGGERVERVRITASATATRTLKNSGILKLTNEQSVHAARSW